MRDILELIYIKPHASHPIDFACGCLPDIRWDIHLRWDKHMVCVKHITHDKIFYGQSTVLDKSWALYCSKGLQFYDHRSNVCVCVCVRVCEREEGLGGESDGDRWNNV